MHAVFWELPSFARYREQYLNDDEYRVLQIEMMSNPTAGKLIPGSGGLRKLRHAYVAKNKGKRGGIRVIYFWRLSEHEFWLFSIYGKDKSIDLTPDQLQVVRRRLKHQLPAKGTSVMKKRNLFNELMEGLDALEAEHAGKAQIKKVRLELPPPPSKAIVDAEKKKNQVH